MCKTILFYDGSCGLCSRVVRFFLWADKKKKFCYAPLSGETARIAGLSPDETSVILKEGETTYREGKAALRALWFLGRAWRIPGAFYFILPGALINPLYRFVARNRQRFFRNDCPLPKNSERFLP